MQPSYNKIISIKSTKSTLVNRNRELSTLLNLSARVSTSLDLHEILDGALSTTMDCFGLCAGRIYLKDRNSGPELLLAAYKGIDPKGLEKVNMETGFTGRAARTRSFIAQRVSELEDAHRAEVLHQQGLEIIICVPLIVGDKVIGVMNLGADREIELDQGAIDLLVVIGAQIGIAANHARLFEELEMRVAELKEKRDTIEFFVCSAAHDLKSPAIGLYGLTQLLERQYAGSLDERGKKYCEQIVKAAGGIVSIIDRINTYVRTREAPLNLERFSLKEILDGVKAEFSLPMKERGVRWMESGAFPLVLADRLSLERVFRNLVDNALKYGGPGLSEIRVECEEKDGKHILYIKDDGVGIKDEDSEALFRPFQRHASSKGIEGSGLGLAIVRELIEKHHGKVWIAPYTGRGTTFCILLP